MKHCANCANLIADSAQYCQYCGQPQDSPQLPPQPTWRRLSEGDPGQTQPVRRQPPAPTAGPSRFQSDPQPNAHTVPPASSQKRGWDANTIYRVLVIALVVIFVCAAGLAVITLWTASTGGVSRLFGRVGDFFQAPQSPVVEAVPSETPLPSFPTPWPTFTPIPTLPPAEATPSGEELKILSAACAAALDHLEQASDQFTQSPTSVFDADWRNQMSQALEETRTACGTLDSASPVPGQVAEVQRLLALTSQTYEDANLLLKEGIDERSPSKVWQAVQMYPQAIKYLNETLAALRAVGH